MRRPVSRIHLCRGRGSPAASAELPSASTSAPAPQPWPEPAGCLYYTHVARALPLVKPNFDRLNQKDLAGSCTCPISGTAGSGLKLQHCTVACLPPTLCRRFPGLASLRLAGAVPGRLHRTRLTYHPFQSRGSLNPFSLPVQ